MRRLLDRCITAGVLLVSLVSLAVTGPVWAATSPSLTTTASANRISQGSVLQVRLNLHPNGVSFDTLSVDASFPTDKFSFAGINKSGSAFDTFIPATPTSHNGQLHFAAAALGKTSVADNALVATLLFKASAATGTATINFTGTKAASGGNALTVNTTPLTVRLQAASGSGAQAFTISKVRITNLATDDATLSWQTSVPTSGNVDYGLSTRYGLTASSPNSENHSVKLTGLSPPKSTAHYRIIAIDSSGNVEQTKDSTFTTQGYTIRISVVNAKQQPIRNVRVALTGGPAGTTNGSGQVLLHDVAPGTQNVIIGNGKSQTIVVKAERGSQAVTPQEFTLQPVSGRNNWPLYGIIAVVVLLILWLITDIRRKRRTN